MRDLSFRAPPSLAVAENAASPAGLVGASIWSTTAGKILTWNGSAWVAGSSGGNQITVSSTAPSNPTLNQLWLDIS